MKTLFRICLLTVLGTTLFSFSFIDNTLTLDQAIAQKKIEIQILPFGDAGYTQGLRMNLKNISGKSLHLKMPAGSIFIPDNGDEQTLTTSSDTVFVLNANQERQIKRRGYCTELHDHGSAAVSTFQLSTTKNQKLVNILGYMDSLRVSESDAIQHAIWCITDNNPVSYVGINDTVAERLVRTRICSLTGQTMPWYQTASEIVQTPEREFVIVPKEVTGEITFNSTEPVHLYGVVKDSTGKILHTSPHVINAPGGVEVSFDFALTVIGWPAGKYSVVYTNNGKEVINQPFEI